MEVRLDKQIIIPPGLINTSFVFQAQVAYPYIGTYYGGIYGAYSGQPLVNAALMAMPPHSVPLVTDAMVEPIYVNARQYHGILRRRQSRAKAESENKAVKIRKPYLHESRHLHALKRARGSGGRFLNSKAVEGKQYSNSVDKKDGAVSSEENRDKEINICTKSENVSPTNQPGADVPNIV
uniref:Nuclear transcription factor Y subunit n=1 Tax=Leersia perrieri TaxID=77586 RepID=A0A0D9X591_9ORYZ